MAAARRRWLRWLLAVVLLFLLAVGAAVGWALSQLGASAGGAWGALSERTPMELIGHASRRLEGHPRLEAIARPVLERLKTWYVREPAAGAKLPDLGKGQRKNGLTGQRYDAEGQPLAAAASLAPIRPSHADRVLLDAAQIHAAVRAATPGQVLEIAPGRHTLGDILYTGAAGRPEAPITLRAASPGSVTLVVRQQKGIVVAHSHWIFENLDWFGACADDDSCEHAFHVVGGARSTVVRNNRITDFNAGIKVNGDGARWPDAGLLQFSTLANTRPRRGSAPVALLDLVGASGWQVLDNRFENFVKGGGSTLSYGLFMKGGGSGGRIERNLVVCTPSGVAQPGQRVGISIGDGGTGAEFCRDRRCATEHDAAVVANNVVAHCNDAGIDIAKARRALVVSNTLVNTQGVIVRTPPSDARVLNNLLDAGLHARDGTVLAESGNQRGKLARWLQGPDALDLRWREAPQPAEPAPEVTSDFCARRRGAVQSVGAGAEVPCEPVARAAQ